MEEIYDISRILITQGTSIKEGSIAALDRYNDRLVPITFSRPSVATIINKFGKIETVSSNIPRWDWSEKLGCPSLLIEKQSSNLSIYSELFEAFLGNWDVNNITISNNAGMSPDGKINANLITSVNSLTSGTVHLKYTTVSSELPSSGIYTISIFAKKGTSNWLAINTVNFSIPNATTYFNLDTGYVGYSDSTHINKGIIDYGNGWYRCYINITLGTDRIGEIRYYISNTNESVLIDRNGSDSLYLWGHQIEYSSTMTSYIPTTNTSVTRFRDIVNKTSLSDYIDDTAGTIIFEASVSDDTINNDISINGGNSTNRVIIRFDIDNTIKAFIIKDGTTIATLIGVNYVPNIYYRIILRYERNNFNLDIDGFSLDFDLDGFTFESGDLHTLSFDGDSNGSLPFYGRVKLLSLLDISLLDSEITDFSLFDTFSEMGVSKNYTII